MTRGGWPIQARAVKNAVNPNIDYSLDFATYEALVVSGLDLWKYERGEYESWFIERVIAWHTLHNQVQLHTQDAKNKKMEHKQKRDARKGRKQ